jgi:hypothetical protein
VRQVTEYAMILRKERWRCHFCQENVIRPLPLYLIKINIENGKDDIGPELLDYFSDILITETNAKKKLNHLPEYINNA